MAKKAAKTLANTNAAHLRQAHLISATLHTIFILLRLIFLHGSWKKYILLSTPALLLEAYLDRIGRPKYRADEQGHRVLVSAGEDLGSKGLMEYAWDVVYVTWICLVVVGVVGERGWWVALVVPMYGAFLAVTLVNDFRQGRIPGMPSMPSMSAEGAGQQGVSKRQQKMEKRGGQRQKVVR
ncbi:hypothetical protein EX30DRAFT_341877 [Ascodesmis nigricans]|uniref:DUF788-domain-containing protein n=1 Tax=Ascodesmis nigricans TaxID=341454 RepID=A0A4V6RHD9_9PEZI|nr:hypothetical protein EX30DRAFT_341877 [Ascodesmis nigricans]